MPSPITWSGEQIVRIVGTGLHEDTLRIRPSDVKQRENRYRLRLPTLCITYVDLKFSNDIGGEQERWPASAAYGPKFFDPPVVIGRADIERLTWIRGAEQVTIGPKETEIEWFGFRELVVPRMRLSVTDPVEATVEVVSSVIDVGEELRLDVAQYANGRLIGGVQVAKRHPDWKPPEEPTSYRLWIRVIDADRQQPFRKARLLLSQWDGKGFTPFESATTDPDGSMVRDGRKPGELEAVTLAMKGLVGGPASVARAARPAPQPVARGGATRADEVPEADLRVSPRSVRGPVPVAAWRHAVDGRRAVPVPRRRGATPPGRYRPPGEPDRAQPAGLVLHAGPDRRHARRHRTRLRRAPRLAADARPAPPPRPTGAVGARGRRSARTRFRVRSKAALATSTDAHSEEANV